MASDNLSVVLKGKGNICLENRKVPEPKPNEVLIAIHAVGICGSDLHLFKDGKIGELLVTDSFVLGHEASGTVVKTGSKVNHLKPGDRICIEPVVPCRKCEFCLGGRYNLCLINQYDHTPIGDGSMCRYFCFDADFCHKLPDNVTLDEGALMEPLSVAVHACRRASVTAGKSVLICGAGPIGLVNFLTCKAMGVTNICITDIAESRLEVAKKIGVTHHLNVKDMDLQTVMEQIKSKLGGCPDITLECSGAESSVKLGLLITKSGGVVMCVGLGSPEMKIPIIEATFREVDIRGVFRYRNCFPVALELVSSGAIDVKPLISHHFSLKEIHKAFETVTSSTSGAIKVLIHSSN